jgi:hypothetical protein
MTTTTADLRHAAERLLIRINEAEAACEAAKQTALDKPMRDFYQVDGWANVEGDYIMVPDDDGDVLMSGRKLEPQNSGTTVRIWIAAEADRADVLRILRKQLAWVESGGALYDGI